MKLERSTSFTRAQPVDARGELIEFVGSWALMTLSARQLDVEITTTTTRESETLHEQ